jgi:hypothetical protein
MPTINTTYLAERFLGERAEFLDQGFGERLDIAARQSSTISSNS